MRPALFSTLAILLLAVPAPGALSAAEPAPPPPAPVEADKHKDPAHVAALKAAAGRWKLRNATERLVRSGATGQHDLFWEILELFEKQEKARKDADLVKVMEWLLFSVNLRSDRDLGPSATRHLPGLVPELGRKLLAARLGDWVERRARHHVGQDPWTWPAFSGKNRKQLAAAAAQLLKTGPRHNPLTRIWISAALLAAGGKGAEKEMAGTWKKLRQRMPSRAAATTAAVASSLAGCGVKAGLGLLLQVAEEDLDRRKQAAAGRKPLPQPGVPSRWGSRHWPQTLLRFQALLGWIQPAGGHYTEERARAEIAAGRKWLKANIARLTWNPKTARYEGGAAQAGMEVLIEAARALRKDYGYRDVDEMAARRVKASSALFNLLAAMSHNQQMAADRNAATVALELVKMAGRSSLSSWGPTPKRFFDQLNSLPKPLAARLFAAAFGDLLRGTRTHNLYSLSAAREVDPGLVERACLQLRPEFKKAYERAAEGKNRVAELEAAMRYMYLGGSITHAELSALLSKCAKSGRYSKNQVKAWMDIMVGAGRTAGLRVCLALAQGESAGGGSYYMRQFGRYAGWYGSRQHSLPDPRTELAKAIEWLPKNEARLKWNKALGRFTGAGAPGSEKLRKIAAGIDKRWGLKIDPATLGQRDGARRLFSEIVALGARKPEIGKDKKLMALLDDLVEPGRIMTDTLLRKKLMVEVPRFSPELGGKYWADFVRKRLSVSGHYSRPSGFSHTRLSREYPGYRRAALQEACKVLKPEFKKAWESSSREKVDARIRKGLAYVAVGGKLAEIGLEALLKEAEKLGSTRRLGLSAWASAITGLGSVEGLELLLVDATHEKAIRAMTFGTYRYAAGRSKDRYGRDLHRLSQDELLKRIRAEMVWLRANKKNLKFDHANGRFKLPGGKVKPPNGGNDERGPDVF